MRALSYQLRPITMIIVSADIVTQEIHETFAFALNIYLDELYYS